LIASLGNSKLNRTLLRNYDAHKILYNFKPTDCSLE
jgi:hypothetical protein